MREAKAGARREEDRKLLRKFLIDSDAYEGRVRERLAAMEERNVSMVMGGATTI